LALFLLLLQPICAASERHIGAAHSATAATTHDAAHADDASRRSLDRTPSCPEMLPDAIASESPVATGKNFPAAGLMVALPLALAARPELTPRSHPAWNTPPPFPLPYYARSARIQR